jgi:acetyl esterase/lipase
MRLSIAAVITIVLTSNVVNAAEPPALVKKTYTYKSAGEVKVQLDVHRPDDTKTRPTLVWIHGGALITGNKSGVPRNLLDLSRDEGYALVSIDYRLAPEVKVPDIISDLEDAFRWIREEGPKQAQLDPDKMIVTGGSAGGYLTLMSGMCLKGKPRALVAYWGYGDLDGEWLSKPSEFYRKSIPLVKKEDALKGVSDKVLTGSEAGFDGKARGLYYMYLRQNGLWTREVTGFDPSTERAKIDPYCPVRNVSPQYPPTMLVHGTTDTDVPYEKSLDMEKEFIKHKVPHELVTVPGAGHGLSNGDKKLVAEAHEKALAFIRKYLD